MTDSLKLAKFQRTHIEYERQRHLANWLIKSGPHMGKPPLSPSSTSIGASTPSKQSLTTTTMTSSAQKATNSHNPLFFLSKVNHHAQPQPDIAIGHSQIACNLQTKLPVQNPIQAAPIGHTQKLPRFVSQCSNMFSVDDFENARLARRNELELKQRQVNRYKKSSLSSGGDCSTGDSKGSKLSNESNSDLLQAELFLERYSLPRVVRVVRQTAVAGHEASSSSSSASTISSPTSGASASASMPAPNEPKGELFLLYRHLRNRKLYHGVNAKNGANRKKGILIPQEFSGYFSVINDKGAPTATQYTTITKLVREKVYKFLSVDNLTAYTESQNTDTFPPRPHYAKGTARGGQVFRLLAVFEDGKQESNASPQPISATFKSNNNAGRYAQLLNENRQIIYVSLASKGKFYEIEDNSHHSTASMRSSAVSDTNGACGVTKPKQVFNDCVHRLSSIISTDTDLPMTLRYIGGPQSSSNVIPESVTITKISIENGVLACPIDENETNAPLHLEKLPLTQEVNFVKSFLGFESELKMFSNQNVQNILKYCQFNCDTYVRNIETEHFAIVKSASTGTNGRTRVDGLKILRPLNFPKLLRREKSLIAHEKEDSIIFLSKNDLENLENKERQVASKSVNMFNDKMKVFQATKKKWFRNGKTSGVKDAHDVGAHSKRMSLDRYQEMSKLLQERFGGNVEIMDDKSELRANSEIGCDPRRATIDSSELRQKSISMQDFDSHSDYSIKPDLVNVDFVTDGNDHDTLESHSNTDDADADSMIAANTKSFITEKLCNEFHVKTKGQSKSSSFLHFSVPRKMNVNEMRKFENDQHRLDERIRFDYTSMMAGSIDDDLPYSNVRDSLVLDTANVIDDSSHTTMAMPTTTTTTTMTTMANSGQAIHTENIYAEICADSSRNAGHDFHPPDYSIQQNDDNDTIRISISSSTNSFDVGRPSPLRHGSTGSSSISDNVYNSLK